MTRDDLIAAIHEIAEENPQWGENIAALVTGFENDEISMDELAELITDYKRQIENEEAIAEVELRGKVEVALESLLALARAAV
tara:strand:+ start:212 stop:460 length:249 start_codon:yes stop_codon:yes gene_type:complete